MSPHRLGVLALFLLCFWLLVSGSGDWQHILIGLLLAWGLAAFWSPLFPKTLQLPSWSWWVRGGSLLAYVCKEVLISSLQVVFYALNPGKISPTFYSFQTPLGSSWARVALANLISLTPGTVTVLLEEDRVLVHALTAQMGRSLPGGGLERRTRRLEEEM